MADDSSGPVEDVEITGEMIRLGQLLKFAGVADSGADAGALVTSGDVLVDGEVETRRGRQLSRGALVEIQTPAGRTGLRIT
ncbi:RNA-binding S4 domain-containing protein [Aeromicrobium sp. CF4.19]|uniref:RNA-binding S4 domain-containing protein n=1 Tax=Aeromicrobium sp. CF4.19 TaxID=3373082 RepID=UPI003EE6FC31